MDIPTLVNSLWNTLQPHLSELVAAGAAARKAPVAISKLWQRLTRQLQARPAAREAIQALQENPADPDIQGQLRAQLRKALQEDPAFLADLTRLLKAAGGTYTANLQGDGAIAQGPGAKAVGKGGVLIEGDVNGNLVMGDDNTIQR